MKPVIGVNGYINGEAFADSPYNMLPRYYTQLLHKSGACPIEIPLGEDCENVEQYVNMVDGLLMPGGDDISPTWYNEEPHSTLAGVILKRDQFEIALILEALKQNKPIFGICRGLQMLNVALGGSLYQDIPTQHKGAMQHTQNAVYYERWHKIKISEDSLLHTIYGREEFVNSVHHQGIKNLSDKLKAVAFANDGIIEAVESNIPGQFIMAVQWHPEMMYEKYPEQAKIMEYFVTVCENNKK